MDEGRPCSKYWEAKHPKNRQVFNSQRLAGVEWEFNDVDDNLHINTWKKSWAADIHHDGSCGREAVTPPASGDFLVKTIQELGEAFKKSNAQVDDRCSIHVHVDAKDLNWTDIYRLLWVYSKLEPLLYILGGQNRLENQYSLPCGKDYSKALGQVDRKGSILGVALNLRNQTDKDAILQKEARRHHRQSTDKKHSGRYRGLNLMPWLVGRRKKAPDTTIEFRIHRNTKDIQRVIGWAELCVRLVEWTARSSDTDAQQLPSSPLRALCEVIAPDLKPWILNRVKGWRKDTSARKRKIRIKNGQYCY